MYTGVQPRHNVWAANKMFTAGWTSWTCHIKMKLITNLNKCLAIDEWSQLNDTQTRLKFKQADLCCNWNHVFKSETLNPGTSCHPHVACISSTVG
jgi:hypothetical protein